MDSEKSASSADDVNRVERGPEVKNTAPDSASITDVDSVHSEDLLAKQDTDPVLNRKMHIVNDAIDEIGWTPYHTKLFCLNGFGYAVDSMVMLFQSVSAPRAFMEFGSHGYTTGLTIALYVGLFTGALFWGLGADIIGRRIAFNTTLIICSISCIIAGFMPSWPTLGLFVSLIGFGAGGNLVLDTTVFLEYIPGNKQWMVTLMALWWGVGQTITGLLAWLYLTPAKWNCASEDDCPRSSNWGWRYVMITGGCIVLFMSVMRLVVVRLKETPKYLLGMGQDKEVIEVFDYIAKKYNRPHSLTIERLEACGKIQKSHSDNRFSLQETFVHLRGLFSTRTLALSTCLIWLSWMLIGLAYPLFFAFLPMYLENRGATFHRSVYETWRNYTLINIISIPGPIIAAFMCNTFLGRRYTMTIGAFITAAFFFGYTAVRTSSADLAMSMCISCFLTIYYGVLFAYTPEVLPSSHRATGNGISVGLNRILGIISAIVAVEADTSTPAPIYTCAAIFIALGLISAIMPFEPYGKRSS